jgi:hypothetical protein
MIAWIIGIVILLVISLFMSDETIEPFEYKPPTVMETKIRPDLTCSDPNSSPIFDRFDNAYMELMGSNLNIPVLHRNRTLAGPQHTRDTAKPEYFSKCIEDENFKVEKTDPNYKDKRGVKVFIVKDDTKVDLFCCKGEMYQPPGTSSQENKVCLPECPSNYTMSSSDRSICIRNDNTCTYTADLSANIQNSWYKTCSALYKQNINITSTINSISTVVSTFSQQTSTVQSNYILLNQELATYVTTNSGSTVPSIVSNVTNYNNNFNNIKNNYSNLYSNIQSNISQRYNTLKADKLRFDTLFNSFNCSNFM